MTDAREEVARAISLAIWRLDYTPRDPQHIPDERYECAQAAARAIITALTASGYVIVSRDFDTGNIAVIEAINGGGCQGWDKNPLDEHVRRARQHWHRVLAAFAAAQKPGG
mgnify:CR=1 FL=1